AIGSSKKCPRWNICPAGRDCTFGGNPLAGRADGTIKTRNNAKIISFHLKIKILLAYLVANVIHQPPR
ncbi:MAG: hypothetical protein IJ756_04595, partial [Paludibacteraceae bacterium]|nr:hypothetical protein [Paludibacteraceae bacterium]